MQTQSEFLVPSKNSLLQNVLIHPITTYSVIGILLILSSLFNAFPGCWVSIFFFIFSFVYIGYRDKYNGRTKVGWSIPVIMCAMTMLMIFFMPSKEIRAAINFETNRSKYERIANFIDENIRTGKLTPSEPYSCVPFVLPEEYKMNSVEKICIFKSLHGQGYFIEFQEEFLESDTFSYATGHVYVSPDCEILLCVPTHDEQLKPVEPNWYFYEKDAYTLR